jgi:hypothetical protein
MFSREDPLRQIVQLSNPYCNCILRLGALNRQEAVDLTYTFNCKSFEFGPDRLEIILCRGRQTFQSTLPEAVSRWIPA